MRQENSPPYARMVGDKFDVSAYCQQPLVVSLDHISSVKFAVFSLIRPALKISARSLFIDDKTITFSNILSHLNSDSSISSPPPEAEPQRPKRSFVQRVIHFLTVGIPLAIIVGLVAGILSFVKNIFNDLTTIFNLGYKLYTMSQQDVQFYKENPHLLPSRNAAIDGIINTGVNFYTRQLIYRKLGMFSFLVKPFMSCMEAILTKRIIRFFERFDSIRNRFNNRATPMPSAPVEPYFNENSDRFKYD